MSAADLIRALADSGTPGPWAPTEHWRAYTFVSALPDGPRVCDVLHAADAAKIVAAVNALPKVADLIEATADHRPTVAGYCVACVGGRRYDRCDIARARDALTAALGVTE